jgi:hypothetical protein
MNEMFLIFFSLTCKKSEVYENNNYVINFMYGNFFAKGLKNY